MNVRDQYPLLLHLLPDSEKEKVLCVTLWMCFKTNKLTTIEGVLKMHKIIRGMFLYTHFQMTKGK